MHTFLDWIDRMDSTEFTITKWIVSAVAVAASLLVVILLNRGI